MKKYQFKWRKVFYNPCRNGKVRVKTLESFSLNDACKQMVDYLNNQFNIELGTSVRVEEKEFNIENKKDLQHLFSSEV